MSSEFKGGFLLGRIFGFAAFIKVLVRFEPLQQAAWPGPLLCRALSRTERILSGFVRLGIKAKRAQVSRTRISELNDKTSEFSPTQKL